jgi:RNA-directed DNA polymerase
MGGRTEVVDADLSSYFDTIPHGNLLRLVARRVVDRGVLGLIKQWLRAPVIEPDDPPGSAGRRSERGTPQGGVISPLLANIYTPASRSCGSGGATPANSAERSSPMPTTS